MLASARQILFADRYVREGDWQRKGPISLGRSVGGKTLGVLGLGGIGRAIADRATAFRMRVLYHGPRKKSPTRPTNTSPTSSSWRAAATISWSPARAGRKPAISFPPP